MTKLKQLFKYIAYIFLFLIVSLSVYTFIMTDILKKDYANVFGYTYFVVATGSMSGEIEVNDVVIVKLTDNVQLNDVITFQNARGEFITHRVVKKNGSTITTKGDVNNAMDESITSSDVVGKVRFVVSPSFVLKLMAVFIILFIMLALLNFDKIFKKYIVSSNDNNKKNMIPDDVFTSRRPEEKSTGNTVLIPIKDVMDIKEDQENKYDRFADVEYLETEDVIGIDENNIIKKTSKAKELEKDLLEQVINLLRIKNDSLTTTRMNKKWLTRYQYVYKLLNIVMNDDMVELVDTVNHPTFKEIYDYDLDKAGLYENLRNKIYDMPIYVFLRILVFAILYNDDEFFDGVYKILKYKVQIDRDNYFKRVPKGDNYSKKQLKLLLVFMQKISERYDNKKVFELDKIEKYVKLKKYVNN